ncbi:hypothetical protein CFREI_06020 [Corynebacterium freiburgense]|nr:hypothetical protein CFREI_06020 [Corynebacterium freiburgense]
MRITLFFSLTHVLAEVFNKVIDLKVHILRDLGLVVVHGLTPWTTSHLWVLRQGLGHAERAPHLICGMSA